MLRNIYIVAWTLLASASIAWILTGKMDPVAISIFSFVTFALFYLFTLWLAFFDRGNAVPKDRIAIIARRDD